MAFLSDLERFYGTGEKNRAGQSLEEFLEGYNPKKYDCPSCTTDIIVVRCEEKLERWGQPLQVLMVKRGNHPSIDFWATPGGFVEMRENLEDAAAWELEEGDIPVKAGDDAADALWMEVRLTRESDGIAVDHGCLIVQALLHLKARLEGYQGKARESQSCCRETGL